MRSCDDTGRDLLATRAATTPERTALVETDTNRELSYATLDKLASDVAAHFEDSCDGPSRRVGCLLSTRVAFAVTLHATHRVGAALVPLGTDLREEALRNRYDRTEPDLLVCEADTEDRAVEVADCPVLSADTPTRDTIGSLLPSDRPETVEPSPVDPGETAVILFTSGTTGEPKGVRLTHRNLKASAVASAFRLGVVPGDRWLCCLAPYHMGGLAPFYRATLYGTTVLIQRKFDAERTGDALDSFGATGVSLVPTQLSRLLDADWTPSPSLKTVLLGGAPASTSLVERALDTGIPVSPTYGLTETASQVATALPSEAAEYPESVGHPLLWTDVTIREKMDLEQDEAGEIIVRGPTVTPGYLDEGQTESAFCTEGFRTGDIGYRDDGGRLYIVGRRDGIIITGGKLVAPAPVAERLTDYGPVADAAVVGIPDDEWGERVVALVVAAENVSQTDLKAFCRAELAGYKCPKEVAFADSIPRTASGTVDREAVKEFF